MRMLVQLLAASVVASMCECVVAYTNFLKCDFEQLNTCQFTQRDLDDLDWTVGDYSYSYLGLSRGARKTRKFAYINNSFKKVTGKAVLRSPKLKPGKYKMQFYNKGYKYASLSVMQVYTIGGLSRTRELFSRSGVEDFNWKKAQFSFEVSSTFWLDIVGTLTKDDKGAFAIDQIELDVESDWRIQLKVGDMFHCSFDYGSLCGLSQSTSDDFDWTFVKGSTPTPNTGPRCGHTNCGAWDYYAYIEATGVGRSKKALLRTPVFVSYNGCVKVAFWYHMLGRSLGWLYVKYLDAFNNLKSTEFSDWFSRTNWRRGEVTINETSLSVVFQASTGSSSYGDIAVDDITITPCYFNPDPAPTILISEGSVQPAQNFSFARNSLSPLIQDVRDDFDWSIGSGQTPTASTGPRLAHGCMSTSCFNKYYAFIESSLATDGVGSRNVGDRALMYTPYRYQSSSRCLRVSLWFHTFGVSLGRLKVVHRSAWTSWQPIWDKPSSSINFWRYMQVDIDAAEPQQIGFEATCGGGKADLAIDDIMITKCSFGSTVPAVNTKTRYVNKDNTHEFYFYSGGTIFTPGYPSDYRNNMNISWMIMIERESSISLMIHGFKTEWGKDYLRVFDLQYGKKILITAYTGTGTKNSNDLDTQSHHVLLTFTSSASVTYKGFTLYWHRLGKDGGSLPQTNNAPDPEYNLPLSTGAIVGIVVGVIVGIIILCCCCSSCKKKKHQADTSAATGGQSQPTANSTAQPYPVQPTVTYNPSAAFTDYSTPYGQPAGGSVTGLSYVPPPGADAYSVPTSAPTTSETSWAPPTYDDYVKSPPSNVSPVPSAPPIEQPFPLTVIPPSQNTDNLPAPPSYDSMYGAK